MPGRGSLEPQVRVGQAQQLRDQVGLHSGRVGEAVEPEAGGGQEARIALEAGARRGERARAMPCLTGVEPLRHARRHAHQRLRSTDRAGRAGLLRQLLGQHLGVDVEQAGVEQVVHHAHHRAVAVAEPIEPVGQGRLASREPTYLHGEEGFRRPGEARRLDDRARDTVEGVELEGEQRPTVLRHQPRGEVLAQAARRNHHAQGSIQRPFRLGRRTQQRPDERALAGPNTGAHGDARAAHGSLGPIPHGPDPPPS